MKTITLSVQATDEQLQAIASKYGIEVEAVGDLIKKEAVDFISAPTIDAVQQQTYQMLGEQMEAIKLQANENVEVTIQ